MSLNDLKFGVYPITQKFFESDDRKLSFEDFLESSTSLKAEIHEGD